LPFSFLLIKKVFNLINLTEPPPSFLERKKQRRRTHLLFIWTASRRPEVPSLKLIQVPSHNSAKNQDFSCHALQALWLKSSEDITGA
tara:strand:+ start:1411 stop:1671 length:261 start_codon:yes stop_codon:yes gene_type:complete